MKKMIWNTRERALSDDMNREVKFIEAEMSELFRAMLNTSGGNDDTDSGNFVENASGSNPMKAEIISGLTVLPQIGSTSCYVARGTVYMQDGASESDLSDYRLVNDPGVQTPGALVMTSNVGGGAIRIDIVECSRVANQVLESANRDIFDTSTGLFTATSVTKVSADRLTYRVRAGTPGAGIPATVAGWLPLAVSVVPDGALNWDACTVYDVRPLLQDRSHGVANLSSEHPSLLENTLNADDSSAGTCILSGVAMVDYKGRRIGGRMRRGTPGTDNDTQLDLMATALAGGFAYTNNTLYHVYLMLPAGLPRWSRYTDPTSGVRKPRGPRGIVVVSTIQPDSYGQPSTPVTMPTSTGFTATVTDGAHIATGVMSGTALKGFLAHNRVTMLPDGVPFAIATSTAASLTQAGDYHLVAGNHFPANAKRVLVYYTAHATAPVDGARLEGFNMQLTVEAKAGNGVGPAYTTDASFAGASFVVDIASPIDIGATAWVTLAAIYPDGIPSGYHRATWGSNSGGTAPPIVLSNSVCYVKGWEV